MRPGFELALLDFELAEDRLETDIDFVPVVFQSPQVAFGALAQVADGGRGADQAMHFLARG